MPGWLGAFFKGSVKGRDTVYYEKSDFDHILQATGKELSKTRQSQLAERLEEYAIAFLDDFGNQKRIPPHAVKKHLDNVATKADALVRLLKSTEVGASARVRLHRASAYHQRIRVRTTRLNSRGEPQEHIGPIQFSEVETAIKAVEDLALYAKYASIDECRKVKSGKNLHRGNVARQNFFNNLAGLWFDTFNELPGGSVRSDTQRDNGPFVRFALACYSPLRQLLPGQPAMSEKSALEHYKKTAEVRLKRLAKKITKSDQK